MRIGSALTLPDELTGAGAVSDSDADAVDSHHQATRMRWRDLTLVERDEDENHANTNARDEANKDEHAEGDRAALESTSYDGNDTSPEDGSFTAN